MPLHIVRNDISQMKADAIVNSANPYPVIGGGAEYSIYETAGKEKLLKARESIGELQEGEAAFTPAYGLNAKVVIHTVAPVWKDGKSGEKERLAACYENALAIAEDLKCESIAFPLLAAGTNGFPKDTALNTAISTVSAYLQEHDTEVWLTVYDRESYRLSEEVYGDVRSYINENSVMMTMSRPRPNHVFDAMPSAAAGPMPKAKKPMVLPKKEDTFQQKLLQLIDESGETDPAVYRRANLDRKLFAKIRKDINYKPSRKTAAALALALRLSEKDAEDLLARAGLALSRSMTSDLILRYCFENHIYNIQEVNAILFAFDQETL